LFTDFVSGVATDKIISKNTSPITRALGIPPLVEETSMNFSAGITAKLYGLTLSVDGYYIDIKDRIVLTGAFEDSDPDIGAELQALNVSAAQFFTNAVDTKSTGVDIVLSYLGKFGEHAMRGTFAANFNSMDLENIYTNAKLTGKEDIYFGLREQKFLLASAPDSKFTLMLDYQWDFIGANVRVIRFGEIVVIDWIDEEDVYEPVITVDVSVSLNITKNITLVIGADNVLNAYPTQQDTETETGGVWDSVQMGFSGAFYYTKLGFRI
jgi:iron complex outermembrane receptor protein